MELKFNQSTADNLEKHLIRCDQLFFPVLSSRVDIKTYAEKIKLNGDTVEFWQDQDLVGCVAFYQNNEENETFITSLSVEEEYQSKGLAKKMLAEMQNKINSKKIRLEVHKNNEKAMSLYLKNGFKLEGNSNDFNILIK